MTEDLLVGVLHHKVMFKQCIELVIVYLMNGI